MSRNKSNKPEKQEEKAQETPERPKIVKSTARITLMSYMVEISNLMKKLKLQNYLMTQVK